MDKRYQVADGYVHRKIADVDILICVRERIADFNGYMTLNPVASFLWDAMKQPKSAKELTLALTEKFEVTEAQAAHDVENFLLHLLEKSMIEEVPYDTL